MNPGAFGRSTTPRRGNGPLILPPTPEPATFIWPASPPAACCMKCIFWDREAAQQADKTLPPSSVCRRFPPRLLVMPVPVQLDDATIRQMRVDPRMAGQIPPNGMIMQQRPTPVRDVSGATDWCGEFDPVQTPNV